MSDKDVLTMLTSEDSAAVRDSVISTNEQQEMYRRLDHEIWQAREEKRVNSKMDVDHAYRTHVVTTTWLNVLSTGATIALCLVIIQYVLIQ